VQDGGRIPWGLEGTMLLVGGIVVVSHSLIAVSEGVSYTALVSIEQFRWAAVDTNEISSICY
jgi:hypothetical protein